MKKEVCCPKFDPVPWDEKLIQWESRKFIKDKVFTISHMPINFGCVVKRLVGKVQKTGAAMPDGLLLAEHTSGWNMDVYLAVDKDVPDAENVTLSGVFFCKVYEGPFKDCEKWMADYEVQTQNRNLVITKTYLWYTTCPQCAKEYGKNYVAILGKTN